MKQSGVLVKVLWIKSHRNLAMHFLEKQRLVFMNSVCMRTQQNISITNIIRINFKIALKNLNVK